jgi:hypothetical protein
MAYSAGTKNGRWGGLDCTRGWAGARGKLGIGFTKSTSDTGWPQWVTALTKVAFEVEAFDAIGRRVL